MIAIQDPFSSPDPLLTVKEAAAYLRVSEGSIYQRVHKGELKPIRMGRLLRFRLSSLEEYVKTCQ